MKNTTVMAPIILRHALNLCICALMIPCCATRVSASLPAFAEIVSQVSDAYRNLGPAAVTLRRTVRAKGEDPRTLNTQIYRNSYTDYVLLDPSTHVYSSDGYTTVYHKGKHVYQVRQTDDLDIRKSLGVLSTTVDLWNLSLDVPGIKDHLSSPNIKHKTLYGKPVYVLNWNKRHISWPFPDKAIIDRSSGLIYELHFASSGAQEIYTAVYNQRNEPYDPETFSFTPPPGSRSMPHTEAPSEEVVSPPMISK